MSDILQLVVALDKYDHYSRGHVRTCGRLNKGSDKLKHIGHFSATLERELQGKLDATARRHRAGCFPEGRRFEKPNRHSKIDVVDEVEDLSAEYQGAVRAYLEVLNDREVEFDQI